MNNNEDETPEEKLLRESLWADVFDLEWDFDPDALDKIRKKIKRKRDSK